jgi:hypothetical protein
MATETDEIRDTATYRVTNATEGMIELPAVEGVEASQRMLGTKLDEQIVGSKSYEISVTGKVLKNLFGNRIFTALVDRGDINVHRGRVLSPRP